LNAALKRLFDILMSAFVLIVLSPLLLLLSVAIIIDSGFPVFFSQVRVGRGFRKFQLRKFRTMRTGLSGSSITVAGDSRITRLGRRLRNAKLDEVPQFWNVLRGDMSVVGPRPEVPEYVELYHERYRRILAVRPGITDLASIQFRNEEAVLAMSPDPLCDYRERVLPMKMDLADRYLQTQSFCGDFAIIARTAMIIARGSHAGIKCADSKATFSQKPTD
jgi:lipopolysaccharide/colanic/teichoic acid biosynthesis glycosyltransferase